MSEWKEVQLQDVISILGDGLHGTPIYDDNGDFYFINGNNLLNGKIVIKDGTKKTNEEEYKKYKKNLNERTILVSINGTLGNVALYNGEKCILGKSACYFNVKDEIEKSFIKYVVVNNNFQTYISEFAHGTTIKNVSLKTMREYPFLLPSTSEQKAIAQVLSSIDDKIDLLHRQNATLEAMAETLFRQWFVEEAKEDWDLGKLSDFGSIITGKTPSTQREELWGNSFAFVTPTDYKNFGMFSSKTQRGLSQEGWNLMKSFHLPPNSIMVTCIGSDMGKVSISNENCITNQQINSIKLYNHKTLGYVYFYLINQYEVLKNIALGGTTMPIINKTEFSNIEIPIPDDESMLKFEAFWNSFSSKINKNQTQIHTLTTLRDTLLPKLMSGEVRIENG